MNKAERIPDNCREGYAVMVTELMKMFTNNKTSGECIVRFKAGVPKEIEKVHRLNQPIKLIVAEILRT